MSEAARSGEPPPPDDEVGALIRTLHHSLQRLEALTGGEVDAVAGPQGQPYLLTRAQAHMRERETLRRADILDALPAHIALLDPTGRVLAVNLAWRRFGHANGDLSADGCMGLNYLEVCDRARGEGAAEAKPVAAGIRRVLAREAASFSIEYPCPSALEARWFLMTATPLRPGDTLGAIVMHVDVTALKQARDDALQSRQRLASVIDSAMDTVISVDEDLRIVLSNPAAERMFGYAAHELLGQPLERLLPERFRAGHGGYIAAFGRTGVTQRRMGALIPLSGLRRNGEEFPIEASISKDRSSGRWLYTAILRDITERARAEHRIKRLNRLYAMLSGINMLIVRAPDRDTLFREACRIAVQAGDFAMAYIATVDPLSLDGRVVAWCGGDAAYIDQLRVTARADTVDSERPDSRALQRLKPLICNDIAGDALLAPHHADMRRRGYRSMACFPLIVAASPDAVLTLIAAEAGVFDEDETQLLTELAKDLSFALDHIAKQARLDYLAYYDALTGLANHSLFLERLAQYLRSAAEAGQQLALYIIDLDRFRSINDNFGRAAGDSLLKQVAEWLKINVGDATLLARVSADRFAAVLPRVKAGGDIAKLLGKAQAAFSSHPFRLDEAVFRIAAKVGVALFPDDGASAEVLFKNAEAALTKAKSRGDRFLFYARSMTTAVAGVPTLENQLRLALERREYVLHYQPKINLVSGRITAAEALIRWNDPHTGLVQPGRFIPILEETGLIHEVGRWALEQALADYRRWSAEGLPAVRIAVNVSPLQLRSRGFIAEVERSLGGSGAAAAGLELEITESLIMEDVQHSIGTLQALRAMGVQVAIDDFGTGFSSLSYLSRLPVDTLKIDRSFIIDMGSGPQGLALVSTIIGLAHALQLNVVAEGVETEEQSRLLRVLNCDEMQGFLFSRPVPAAAFEARFLRPAPAKKSR
ncbi:MAG: EAL domain-containing protein [Burkholderiaceae bacterium]